MKRINAITIDVENPFQGEAMSYDLAPRRELLLVTAASAAVHARN